YVNRVRWICRQQLGQPINHASSALKIPHPTTSTVRSALPEPLRRLAHNLKQKPARLISVVVRECRADDGAGTVLGPQAERAQRLDDIALPAPRQAFHQQLALLDV